MSIARRGSRCAARRRSAGGGSPAFRASARGNDEATGNNKTCVITVPGSVQAGDVMTVVGAQNTGANTMTIAGGGSGATWTARQSARTVSGNNLRAYCWTARATGSSAGSTITITSTGSNRFPGLLIAASDVTETGIVTDFTTVNAAGTSHAFPSVTVVTGGSFLIGIAALRTGTDTAATLSAPAGSTLDDSSNTLVPASPSLTVAGLHANSTVAAGSRTPGTATSSADASSVLFTLALPPA